MSLFLCRTLLQAARHTSPYLHEKRGDQEEKKSSRRERNRSDHRKQPGAEAVNPNGSFLDTTITNGNDSDDRMSMSDEAAAEVLLGVGRRHKGLQAQSASSDTGSRFETLKRNADEELDLEDELDDGTERGRRNKRARRAKRQTARDKVANPEEVDELVDDDLGLSVFKSERSKKGRSPRDSGTHTPINLDASSLVQALQRQRELENLSEDRLNPLNQNFKHRTTVHLPPINAALGLPVHSYPASRNATAPSSRAHSHSPTSFGRSLHPMPPHPMINHSHPHSMPLIQVDIAVPLTHLPLRPPLLKATSETRCQSRTTCLLTRNWRPTIINCIPSAAAWRRCSKEPMIF